MASALLVGGILPWDVLAAGVRLMLADLALAARTLTISEVNGAILAKLSPAGAPRGDLWTSNEAPTWCRRANDIYKGCWLSTLGFSSLGWRTRTIPEKHKQGRSSS